MATDAAVTPVDGTRELGEIHERRRVLGTRHLQIFDPMALQAVLVVGAGPNRPSDEQERGQEKKDGGSAHGDSSCSGGWDHGRSVRTLLEPGSILTPELVVGEAPALAALSGNKKTRGFPGRMLLIGRTFRRSLSQLENCARKRSLAGGRPCIPSSHFRGTFNSGPRSIRIPLKCSQNYRSVIILDTLAFDKKRMGEADAA
jgi:hypothetical protein